jgi:hypothetical protein
MKGIRNNGMALAAAAFLMMTAGCIVTDNSSTDSNGCDTCNAPPPLVYVWDQVGPSEYTLMVGGSCGCGECPDPGDEDYIVDTIELDSWDSNIVDLQFHYTLTNWSGDVAPVDVWLHDWQGWVPLLSIDLYPYEVYEARQISPVLDSLLDAYYDCLWDYGNACVLDYDVQVDLYGYDSCIPVTMDYYYEGQFVY